MRITCIILSLLLLESLLSCGPHGRVNIKNIEITNTNTTIQYWFHPNYSYESVALLATNATQQYDGDLAAIYMSSTYDEFILIPYKSTIKTSSSHCVTFEHDISRYDGEVYFIVFTRLDEKHFDYCYSTNLSQFN